MRVRRCCCSPPRAAAALGRALAAADLSGACRSGFLPRGPASRRPPTLLPSAGVFEVKLNLTPGAYEYKFVVDSQWLHDAEAPTVRNSFGSVNNLLRVAAGGSNNAESHLSLGNKFDSATSFVDSEAPPREIVAASQPAPQRRRRRTRPSCARPSPRRT